MMQGVEDSIQMHVQTALCGHIWSHVQLSMVGTGMCATVPLSMSRGQWCSQAPGVAQLSSFSRRASADSRARNWAGEPGVA